jgi:hypothetical protein
MAGSTLSLQKSTRAPNHRQHVNDARNTITNRRIIARCAQRRQTHADDLSLSRVFFDIPMAMSPKQEAPSLWRPLRTPIFRQLLIADVASDVGTFMQGVGAA